MRGVRSGSSLHDAWRENGDCRTHGLARPRGKDGGETKEFEIVIWYSFYTAATVLGVVWGGGGELGVGCECIHTEGQHIWTWDMNTIESNFLFCPDGVHATRLWFPERSGTRWAFQGPVLRCCDRRLCERPRVMRRLTRAYSMYSFFVIRANTNYCSFWNDEM